MKIVLTSAPEVNLKIEILWKSLCFLDVVILAHEKAIGMRRSKEADGFLPTWC